MMLKCGGRLKDRHATFVYSFRGCSESSFTILSGSTGKAAGSFEQMGLSRDGDKIIRLNGGD